MQKTGIISFIILLSVLLLGCKEVKEPDIYAQRTKIESYITDITSKNEDFIQDEHLFNKTGVYRVTFEHDTQKPKLAVGDSVEFWFVGELFKSAPEGVFYTNVPEILSDLASQNLNAEHWPQTPLKAKLGTTPMIKGLRVGLEGCNEQDSLILLLTSDLAFKTSQMPSIPENSIVSYKIRINKVTKAQ